MAEDPGEQQELNETTEDFGETTRQEQISNLYNSTELPKIAIGFWVKFIVEILIVSAGVGVIVLPIGALLAFLSVGPVTYHRTILAWLSFTGSIMLAVWCFTESAEPTDSEGENQD